MFYRREAMANENETVVNGQQIFEALQSITENAMVKKKERGIDFRFLDKIGTEKIDKSKVYEEVQRLEKNLEDFGITVEFYENIDIKDALKENKFTFRIYDNNNCFVEVNALEYRKVVLDANVSEVDYIVEKLFKMLGLKVQEDALKISELIVELISYVYYFDALQYKIYDAIGWDIYNNELVFKYDRIYSEKSKEIRSICTNEIAGKLTSDYEESDKEHWRNRFANLMNSSVEARIVISSACTGLIRSIIPYSKETNINMNVVGEPGSGKSTLCQLALSIFGSPTALEGSFIDKENAMEIIRAKRPIIPYVLDDRLLKLDKLSDDNQGRELMFDIFREYEGKVTERAGGTYRKLSGMRSNAPIISSSVEPMMDVLRRSGKDLGQYRRFIEINLERENIFNGDSQIANEYQKLAYQRYGIGYQYIVEYILNIGIRVVNAVYKCNLENITQKLREKAEQEIIRGLDASASRFALIATTYMIIREAMNDSNIEEVVECVGRTTSEEGKKKNEEIKEVRTYVQWLDYEKQYGQNENKYLSTWNEDDKVNNKNKDKTHKDTEEMFTRFIVEKVDECYDEMVEYLIDNLVTKMKKVKVKVDVYENIMGFIDKHGSTWLSNSNKTNFFNNKEEKIAMIQKIGNSTKLMFRDNKCVEKILCAGVELSDEQIKEYILAINNSAGFNEIAKQYLGDALFDVDYKGEIEKLNFMSFEKEKRAGNEQTPASITIRPIEHKEDK